MATNAVPLKRCVEIIASGIEHRLRRIDELVAEVAAQMRQIEDRRQAIRALMEDMRDE